MGLLSFELGMFVITTFLLVKINKAIPFAFKIIGKRTICIPPQDSDYEAIKKAKEIEKEAEKKGSKSKKGTDAQIPLRSIELTPKLLNYADEKFVEYDFVVMITIISAVCFIVGQTIKLINPDFMDSNFSFYMLILFYLMLTWNLFKEAFLPFTFADDQKILCLFALKVFIVSFAITTYYDDSFDFDFLGGAESLQKALDQIFIILGTRVFVGRELISVCLSIFSALVSVTVVDRGVKYAYHFHTVLKNEEQLKLESNPDKEVLSGIQALKHKMIVGFVIPVVIIFLHVPSLSRDLLGLNNETWLGVKALTCIVFTMMRASTF